jgi:hypothetical protein
MTDGYLLLNFSFSLSPSNMYVYLQLHGVPSSTGEPIGLTNTIVEVLISSVLICRCGDECHLPTQFSDLTGGSVSQKKVGVS